MNGPKLVAAVAAVVLVGAIGSATRLHAAGNSPFAEDNNNVPKGTDFQSLAEFGLNIAPVTLKYAEKDRDLVGYGSYLVNAVADCNGCHSAGPQTEYQGGHNPYFLNPGSTEVNPNTYLGGGRDFGPYGSLPHLLSRNLTPDKSGRAEGGRSFNEFVQIMRTGVDLDNVHPSCPPLPSPQPANCLSPPFDGSRLQIMPWPDFQNSSDQDLLAIYTYLSAVPCLSTGAVGSLLYNDCGH